MIGRPRNYRSFVDDVDPGALHVFIPGALASGFLISVAMLIGDALRRIRGDAVSERRITITSAALAEEIRSGPGGARSVATGLRARWVYGVVGGSSLGLALAVIPGATWNFLNPIGYIDHIGWIWAVSLLLVIPLVTVGRTRCVWLPSGCRGRRS